MLLRLRCPRVDKPDNPFHIVQLAADQCGVAGKVFGREDSPRQFFRRQLDGAVRLETQVGELGDGLGAAASGAATGAGPSPAG